MGLFNTNVDLETLIDTETGEVIETNRPWWAFLVVGSDDATICHLEDETHSKTANILISEVKEHLSHGDSVGECVAVCGDGIIQEDSEQCDDGNILDGDECDSLCQVQNLPVTEPVV